MRSNPMLELRRTLKDSTELAEALKKAPSFKPLKPLRLALEGYKNEIDSVMETLIGTGLRPRDAVHEMIKASFSFGFNAGRAYEQGQSR